MDMTSQDIIRFLNLLGIETVLNDAQRGWVRCSCPLAPWLHAEGKDNNPSFGIKVPEKEGEAPYYTCFTCNSTGPLPRLLHNLNFLEQKEHKEASEFLSQFEVFDPQTYEGEDTSGEPRKARRFTLPDRYANISFSNAEPKENFAVPQSVLDKYPLLNEPCDLNAHRDALLWLTKERKISLQSIAKFKLRLYISPLDEIGVVYPIIDKDGITVRDLWARLIDKKTFFRITPHMAGSNVEYKAPNLLFGNHVFDPSKPVIIVEGAIDALKLHTLGLQNVLATLGGISNAQIAGLYAPVVYLGFDSDDAGRKFTKKALEKLYVPSIHVLDWSVVNRKDAGALETLTEFRQVFDQRTKILFDKNGKQRKLSEQRAKKVFLGDDGKIQ